MSVFTNPASSSVEQAQAYIEAVLGLVGEADAIGVRSATADVLRRGIDGMSIDQLSRPEAPGKWSVRQVLRHLADDSAGRGSQSRPKRELWVTLRRLESQHCV